MQLGLFSAVRADFAEERAVAAKLPAHVLFGTSSWTFPGWSGLCYPPHTSEKELRERGLELYARYPLFRTVGIDRSYYGPIPEAELARYAQQLPSAFPTVMKVWNGITTPFDPRTGEIIDTYLDVATLEREVLGPVSRAFAAHAGVLMFEFAPMRGLALPGARDFAARLDAFFRELPKGFTYAVEIRNRELFTPAYIDTLGRHGVAHVINLWEAMPDVGHQSRVPGVLTGPVVVTRLLLRPGTKYAARVEAMRPFDRIVDENEEMRRGVEELCRMTAQAKKQLFVLVNNKAEGSSPLTVRALAERLTKRGAVG